MESEPMDVDLSSNSVHAMDISYTDTDIDIPLIKLKEEICDPDITETDMENKIVNIIDDRYDTAQSAIPTGIKKFSVVITPRERKKPLSNLALSFIFIVLTLLSILVYQINNFECSKDIDLEVLKTSLSANVYGQQKAINEIIVSLSNRTSNNLLILYGGTGVGKTLTVSLILKNLYQYANIYHYTMPSFFDKFSSEFMLGLTLCPTSMIVVDDLNRTDMHVVEYIKEVVDKSEKLKKSISIILVYNCDTVSDQYIKKCDYSSYSNLKQTFTKIKAHKSFIKFNSLTEEHLKKCIEAELGIENLSKVDFENISKNFNVSLDGCKGVYTKIKLLNNV